MLYSNLAPETGGQKLFLGKRGSNRELMSLDCPKDTKLCFGDNYEYTLSFAKPYCPKVVHEFSADVCLLLSAEGIPYLPIPGRISVLASHIHLLEYKSGSSSYYDYTWPCAAIRVPDIDTIIRVQRMAYREEQFYFVPRSKGNNVYVCTLDKSVDFRTILEQCKLLKLDTPPCTIITNKDGTKHLVESEWVDLKY
jgi:hypothetical protein